MVWVGPEADSGRIRGPVEIEPNLIRVPALLIVHHTPSPGTRRLLAATVAGAEAGMAATDQARPGQAGRAQVIERPALVASASDVLAADGYVLATTANFGYMSGALKHFFDTVFEAVGETTAGRHFGLWVHGRTDVRGALASVEPITAGLGWRRAQPDIGFVGPVTVDDEGACWEMGAALAAGLSI